MMAITIRELEVVAAPAEAAAPAGPAAPRLPDLADQQRIMARAARRRARLAAH
jgi:hypothetical protein